MLKTGRFTVINESFVCENCRKDVLPAKSSCRNHCPHCLHSKHVDEMPGDRSNNCGGLMKPIDWEKTTKKGIVISFKCLKCGEVRKNKAAWNDKIQPDNIDLLFDLKPSLR